MNISLIFAIGIGGFFGAVSRFLISTFIQKFTGSFFPLGTLGVNMLGSFIIGFLALYFENVISPNQKALLITGFLGALTTFSTFSYETVSMLQNSLYYRAITNITLNVFLSILSTIAGIILFKKIYGGI
ncbi:fluoride efflux transporter CrcB [Nitrosophilus kaiyonis]|uniref:fluoride efflux transporter CrcB n=1 Tax=Nitrosophilus kaiyonis TaxID=2930200 RepID=UPI0024938350|nr:fluoride efflux transporter CrcB [Nitrosophilus kaiyonis]